MSRSGQTPFVRAVKRAFADALVLEIHRCRLRRDETATKAGVSRAHLQLLLKGDRHASIGMLISLAEGLGMRPEALLAKTMENLSRIRMHSASMEHEAACRQVRTTTHEEQGEEGK